MPTRPFYVNQVSMAGAESDPVYNAEKGVADGAATLDATGNVPASQLGNARQPASAWAIAGFQYRSTADPNGAGILAVYNPTKQYIMCVDYPFLPPGGIQGNQTLVACYGAAGYGDSIPIEGTAPYVVVIDSNLGPITFDPRSAGNAAFVLENAVDMWGFPLILETSANPATNIYLDAGPLQQFGWTYQDTGFVDVAYVVLERTP